MAKHSGSTRGEKMSSYPWPRWYHSNIGCGVAVLLAGLGIGGCVYFPELMKAVGKVSENRQGVSYIEYESGERGVLYDGKRYIREEDLKGLQGLDLKVRDSKTTND